MKSLGKTLSTLKTIERPDFSPGGTRIHRAGLRFRIVLIVPFISLLVVAIGLIGWISFRNGQSSVWDISRRLLSEINARISDHLGNFLEKPRRIIAWNTNAISRGMLDPRDQEALEQHFLQQIRVFESVSSAYFGNTSGGIADAGREASGGSLYIMATDGFAAGHLSKRAVASDGRSAQLLASVPSFDARTRP